MRKVIPFPVGRRRIGPRPMPYKCVNHEAGCRNVVDKPGNVCWDCTMAEWRASKTDEPKGAA